MEKAKLDRINELAKKKKDGTLTPKEAEERKAAQKAERAARLAAEEAERKAREAAEAAAQAERERLDMQAVDK